MWLCFSVLKIYLRILILFIALIFDINHVKGDFVIYSVSSWRNPIKRRRNLWDYLGTSWQFQLFLFKSFFKILTSVRLYFKSLWFFYCCFFYDVIIVVFVCFILFDKSYDLLAWYEQDIFTIKREIFITHIFKRIT